MKHNRFLDRVDRGTCEVSYEGGIDMKPFVVRFAYGVQMKIRPLLHWLVEIPYNTKVYALV